MNPDQNSNAIFLASDPPDETKNPYVAAFSPVLAFFFAKSFRSRAPDPFCDASVPRYATPINGAYLRSVVLVVARASNARRPTPVSPFAPPKAVRRREKNDASRSSQPFPIRLRPGTLRNMASMTSSAVMPASRVAGFAPRRTTNARVVRRGAVAQAARGEYPQENQRARCHSFLPARARARRVPDPTHRAVLRRGSRAHEASRHTTTLSRAALTIPVPPTRRRRRSPQRPAAPPPTRPSPPRPSPTTSRLRP